MDIKSLLVLVILSSVLVSAPVFSNSISPSDEAVETRPTDPIFKKETLVSSQGIHFTVQFNRSSLVVSARAENRDGQDINYSSFNVVVDGHYIEEYTINLSKDESWYRSVRVLEGLNVLRSDHNVVVSTIGNYTQFNFTKEIDPSDSGPVLTPYIEDIEVTNGTIDGEPSAVANVTLVNPSIQTYPTKLMVHTHGTDGSFYGASVRPGGRTTITVELLDERGSRIAGEARLYAGNLSTGDGAMDQVEFVGRAGNETETWNKSYEPIKGPWQNDGYEYRNETLVSEPSLADRLSGGITVWGVPVVYPIVGLVTLLGFIRWRR